jgi:hypothetical protein
MNESVLLCGFVSFLHILQICNSLSNALKLLKKATFYYFFEKLISKIKLQFLLKTLLVFNDINWELYFVIIN